MVKSYEEDVLIRCEAHVVHHEHKALKQWLAKLVEKRHFTDRVAADTDLQFFLQRIRQPLYRGEHLILLTAVLLGIAHKITVDRASKCFRIRCRRFDPT